MLDFLLLFFFKQKTAYELRISDWSSDVCSSDLARHGLLDHADGARTARPGPRGGPGRAVRQRDDPAAHDRHPHRQPALRRGRPDHRAAGLRQHRRPVEVPDARRGDRMSHLDALPPWAAILVAVVVLAGALFAFIGSPGLPRRTTFYRSDERRVGKVCVSKT